MSFLSYSGIEFCLSCNVKRSLSANNYCKHDLKKFLSLKAELMILMVENKILLDQDLDKVT